MKKGIFCIVLMLFSSATTIARQQEKLNRLFEEIQEISSSYAVENPILNGRHASQFRFQTITNQLEEAEKLKVKLSGLEEINPSELSEQDRINKEIMTLRVRNIISQVEYKIYLIPFNAEGGFFNSPSFFLSNLPFNTLKDYENYLQWLPSFVDYLTYNQGLLKEGIKEQIQAPKVIVQNILALLAPWTQADPTLHPFYVPIANLPQNISAADRLRIKSEATSIIQNDILPTYLALKDFLMKDYLPSAPEKVGISGIRNGKAYYENRVRHFTTLDITPDEVFSTGEAEVIRIKKLMQQIIDDVQFNGSFGDFIQFLRTDSQFYPKSEQELLNYASWLSKKAEGQLPRLFSKLYELPFTVEPVPPAIAPNYTGGRYVNGNRERNRPGIYWVNTFNLKSRTLYTLPALSLHEAVPGHHLQIQLASELTDVPDFRKSYYISAFGEGWGLYSEFLGEEMGMYATPYDLFGRYTYEMWRACRLVVDVGMHYKGWTREKAVEFMASNTALSLHEVNTEIDRYIGWPGQALSYKIGELTIIRLRKEAVDILGDQFDIQEFHQAVLKNGSVPLPVLEEQVLRYISSAKD